MLRSDDGDLEELYAGLLLLRKGKGPSGEPEGPCKQTVSCGSNLRYSAHLNSPAFSQINSPLHRRSRKES